MATVLGIAYVTMMMVNLNYWKRTEAGLFRIIPVDTIDIIIIIILLLLLILLA